MSRSIAVFSCTLLSVASMLPAAEHYLNFYDPVVVFSLDDDPNAVAIAGSSEGVAGQVHQLEGVPKLIPGARAFLGNAWDFNETTSCYTSPPNDGMLTIGDLENTQGASVSFWIKGLIRGEENNHRVLNYGPIDVSLSKGIGSGKYAGGLNIGVGKYGGSIIANKEYPIFDDEWHLLTLTADFTQTEDNVVLYLDGQEQKRYSRSTASSFNYTSKRYHAVIGARSSKTYAASVSVDDVAFYNKTLTAEQVAGIYAGPGFPGVDKEVFLPAHAELEGAALEGQRVVWTKESGPDEVFFLAANEPSTQVAFTSAGDYTLAYQVEGLGKHSLQVKVHPPAAPELSICDPQEIRLPENSARLSASCVVKGMQDLSGVKFQWEQIEGPKSVDFAQANALETAVRLHEAGVYRFRLNAEANEQQVEAVTTVNFGEAPTKHYALLTDPLYLLSFDSVANRESSGILELAQKTSVEMKSTLDDPNLPQMTSGARSFTGNGWDFANAESWVGAHARFNLAELGHIERTRGLSTSFWFKGEDYQRSYGRIGGAGGGHTLDISPRWMGNNTAGLYFGSNGGKFIVHSPQGLNLFDGAWHHAVLSVDFDTEEENIKLYVDGELATVQSHLFDESFASVRRTDKYHAWGSRANGGFDPFKGMLDDVAVYNRPLTAAEVAYLYNGPTASQLELLSEPSPVVSVGEDVVRKLPCTSVQLEGAVESTHSDVQLRWELVSGPGPVTFSDATSLNPEVRFGEIRPIHNPDYRQYVFRLNAEIIGSTDREAEAVARLRGYEEQSVILYDNNTPKTIEFSKTPAPGIHPRILFAPEDLPEMRRRFREDAAAQAAAASMHARYDRGIRNPNSDIGKMYQLLAISDEPSVKTLMGTGHLDTGRYPYGEGEFFGKLGGLAFLALMEEDEVLGRELAAVASNTAKSFLRDYRPDYRNYLTHDARAAVGYTYDFLYNWMDEAQRKPLRDLLSQMTKWRHALGAGEESHKNASNWQLFHDGIVIASLAIEGEEGYDPDVYQQNKYKLRDFCTQHGIFKSGYAHEGWGYFTFGMHSGALTLLATSRRGENLFETTNLYASILAHYRSIPPGMDRIVSHGDAPGGWLADPTNLVQIAALLWPEEAIIQEMRDVLIEDELQGKDTRGQNLAMAMFATASDRQHQPAARLAAREQLPLTLFCPDKGYLNTRTNWNDRGMQLTFRCRMDKYQLGHVHPDVNSFELYADGVEWFSDPGKAELPNDWHQTVLVNGVGGGGSSRAFAWPSFPGRFLNYTESDQVVYGSGDAKPFYDYVFAKPIAGDLVAMIDPTPVKPEDFDMVWADYVFGKERSEVLEKWRHIPYLNRSPGTISTFNPVQSAYRSVLMVRGEHPYVIVIDDINKDENPQDYQWVGNLRAKTVDLVESSESGVVLKQVAVPEKQLLVALLSSADAAAQPRFERRTLYTDANTRHEAYQVLIDAKATNPRFKTLLYPFTEGAPQPVITEDVDGSSFRIELPGQDDRIEFTLGADGRSLPRLIRNGDVLVDIKE